MELGSRIPGFYGNPREQIPEHVDEDGRFFFGGNKQFDLFVCEILSGANNGFRLNIFLGRR